MFNRKFNLCNFTSMFASFLFIIGSLIWVIKILYIDKVHVLILDIISGLLFTLGSVLFFIIPLIPKDSYI